MTRASALSAIVLVATPATLAGAACGGDSEADTRFFSCTTHAWPPSRASPPPARWFRLRSFRPT